MPKKYSVLAPDSFASSARLRKCFRALAAKDFNYESNICNQLE